MYKQYRPIIDNCQTTSFRQVNDLRAFGENRMCALPSLSSYTAARVQGDKPCSKPLNELSLMSPGSPTSARFTVTPPNRSTFPVKALTPWTC